MATDYHNDRRIAKLIKHAGQGGVVLGPLVSGLDPLLKQLQSTYVVHTLWAGALITAAGLVACGLGKAWEAMPRRFYSCAIQPMHEADIGSLEAILERFADGGIVPTGFKLDILRRNRRQFFVVERVGGQSEHKTVGFFFFYALKKGAAEDIRQGRRIGANMRPEDIAQSNRRAAAFYVGFIWGG